MKATARIRRHWAGPVGALCAVVTLLVLLGSLAVAAVQRTALDREAIRENRARLAAHEEQLQELRPAIAEIRADVRHIRELLEDDP